MKLYYLTGACSLASFICLTEAGVPFERVAVDRKTRSTADGEDFNQINPKGYVPALRLDSGALLTENVAVLSYIADLNPAARLAPPTGTFERYRLLEWLGYVNGEVHKNFSVLFNASSPEVTRTAAQSSLARRLGFIETALGEAPFLMGDDFSVADAYLYVTLSWRARVGVDITPLARLTALYERVRARPSVQAARVAEGLAP